MQSAFPKALEPAASLENALEELDPLYSGTRQYSGKTVKRVELFHDRHHEEVPVPDQGWDKHRTHYPRGNMFNENELTGQNHVLDITTVLP